MAMKTPISGSSEVESSRVLRRRTPVTPMLSPSTSSRVARKAFTSSSGSLRMNPTVSLKITVCSQASAPDCEEALRRGNTSPFYYKGEVVKFAPIGESHELVIRAPAAIAGYIAKKGSITVNGVSLTVNRVESRDFWINLIPHTVAMTNLKHLAAGSKVNLEIDLIARYVERMLEWKKDEAAQA